MTELAYLALYFLPDLTLAFGWRSLPRSVELLKCWLDQGQPKLERSITRPVAANAQANTRLRFSAAMRCVRRAPNQAPTVCAGAMQAHIERLIEPKSATCDGAEAKAAIAVPGTPTTTPTAAARPTLLCIGTPDSPMTTLVMMPPPTPAKPETRPMPTPATRGKLPFGGSCKSGWNRPGAAKRTAAMSANRPKTPVSTLPRRCGATSCAATTPIAIPGPRSRKNAMSVFPARQWPTEEANAAGRIAASEVATATCAA